MLARLAAIGSLVIGLWAALAVLSLWGAGGGAIAAPTAIVLAAATLTEQTSRRARRAALVGFGVLVVLALLGL